MTEPVESKFLQEIQPEFDTQLIEENIDVLNLLKETLPNYLESHYLDSEKQVEILVYRITSKDYKKIYTIPTYADYVVLSPFGATIFKLFNTTNPENGSSPKRYDPSDLTDTGLRLITKHLIRGSLCGRVISTAIEQEDNEKEVFQVVGVNLPNLLQIYCNQGHPYLRYFDEKDWEIARGVNNRYKDFQKILNKHCK